jgi:hypothetical protein
VLFFINLPTENCNHVVGKNKLLKIPGENGSEDVGQKQRAKTRGKDKGQRQGAKTRGKDKGQRQGAKTRGRDKGQTVGQPCSNRYS